MLELTQKRYESLPEVKKKREEEKRKEQWLNDLKNRKNKVKQMDEVNR
jgi:hypothetical protein